MISKLNLVLSDYADRGIKALGTRPKERRPACATLRRGRQGTGRTVNFMEETYINVYSRNESQKTRAERR